MANMNLAVLMGRLTSDPELRHTGSGVAVTDLRLAVNRQWKTADGESREETLFIDATVWKGQAETCCRYLRKGREVAIQGRLRMETWDDKSTGEKRSKLKVEADVVQFLGGPDGDRDAGPSQARPPARSEPPPRRPPGGGGGGGGGGGMRGDRLPPARPYNPPPDEDDSEIPF